ncbi:hypothetical protein LTR28_012706 [Elasticomyces elasticus]|nr:hypothetical protein LTR28_012706 [Elasticomyces elasticus]
MGDPDVHWKCSGQGLAEFSTVYKYVTALALIDDAHALDPNKVTISGSGVPYELHYAQKMTKYFQVRAPKAAEVLRLTIRAQHFRRWVPHAAPTL